MSKSKALWGHCTGPLRRVHSNFARACASSPAQEVYPSSDLPGMRTEKAGTRHRTAHELSSDHRPALSPLRKR